MEHPTINLGDFPASPVYDYRMGIPLFVMYNNSQSWLVAWMLYGIGFRFSILNYWAIMVYS